MAITASDVKLVASQTMLDTPEGGGSPSANAISDGVSNSIFPDISELDRAGGRVNLRKVFATVNTEDTDTYFGVNVIVAEPPKDPRVSVTLFSTDGFFDKRTDATVRTESYLTKGGEWAGYLWENHIVGQRVVQFFQRPADPTPNVGQTLVLVMDEGAPTEKTQYIRVTAVSSVTRQFFDTASGTDYTAAIVSLSLSDSLRYDFLGSPASRSFSRESGKTKTRDTVVADAGMYAGVTSLQSASNVGDFAVSVNSIFTQLVPSAQTETPVNDVRSNGVQAGLVATGAEITKAIPYAIQPGQNLFAGSPILPGSVNYGTAQINITDEGGILKAAGQQVGAVDYENGILSLSTPVFGNTTTTLRYVPAATPDLISDQRSIAVTAESRSLNYTLTLDNLPTPKSMSVSYLARGRWYVLRDNGAGVLRGSDAQFGAGTVNYQTGSVLITLGALPDVGSAILIQSYSAAASVTPSNTSLANDGRAYIAINSDGLLSDTKGSKTFAPNNTTITWGPGKTATDDGSGRLTGDATGVVNYAQGVIYFSPNVLPAPGVTLSITSQARGVQAGININTVGGNVGSANIKPNSVQFTVAATVFYDKPQSSPPYASMPFIFRESDPLLVRDDGNGNLFVEFEGTKYPFGTVDYTAGKINAPSGATTIYPSKTDALGPNVLYSGDGYFAQASAIPWNKALSQSNFFVRKVDIYSNASAKVEFTTGASAENTVTVVVDQWQLRVSQVPNWTLRGVGFTLGGLRYEQISDGTLRHSVNPATGVGTPCGSVNAVSGVVTIQQWSPSASSVVSDWRAVIAPPTEITAAPFTNYRTVFRTASAPIRPGTFSVLGTLHDGTTFNVTAATDGKINSPRVKGKIDYEYGVVELFFVTPTPQPGAKIVLTQLGIPGLTEATPDFVRLNSVRYNATAYSYLPLDADVIGIDPVRLPTDGRVPIFRPGGFAVVGHTGKVGPATVSNGQTVNCGRVRLSRVRVVGANGQVITTGYTADLEAGTVTFSNVTGYSQPVTVEHRIEDMGLVSDAQINGEIRFTRPLSHAYPAGSYVSSALIAGDLKSRVSHFFDQQTWTTAWADSPIGNQAVASYNAALNPVVVTNKGAITERWAIVFSGPTAFQIIGEHVGIIGTGSTATDCSPVNPATGTPYFTLSAAGWGLGWTAGNVLRINTVAASFPVWCVRTILQGPETVQNDDFTILVRGDINR